MEKVVPLFKSFTIIFYLKFLEFRKDTFGSNQFKFFLKYLNKLRRVLFSLGPAHFPSSPTGLHSLGMAHALDSLLPCSRTVPPVARLRWSRVFPVARPPLLEGVVPYRTPPLSLSYASRLGPFSTISPLGPGAKKPPSTATFLPTSSALGSSHRSPHTTFATYPRR
jgi:hypothetical protein